MRKTSYGREREIYEDYEPSITDSGEEIETPSDVLTACLNDFEKEVKPLLRKISRFFKGMGWSVDINHHESGFDNGYAGSRLSTEYDIDLVIKGGQKLVLGRKQWVSDGNYNPSFTIVFNSAEAEDKEEGEPYEVQRDVDDFEQIPTYYVLPRSDFEYFEFVDGDIPRKIFSDEFDERDIEKVLSSWVMWFTHHNMNGSMRSKWKKKRAMVTRVASRYLEKRR